MKPSVLVIMATYNGEQYLREQIESILAQEGVNVQLQINDDGSSDNTVSIIQEYSKLTSAVILHRNKRNLGVGLNFLQGFYNGSYSGYDFYAYSDQDDIWKTNKLEYACETLGPYIYEPALWFCDVMNVDIDGKELGSEMAAYRRCEDYIGTPLIYNYANGCAQVFNNQMGILISHYRRKSYERLHDAWTMLIARYCGQVISNFDYIGQVRRIHAKNVVGQSGNRIKKVRDIPKATCRLLRNSTHSASKTAIDFVAGYGDYIHQDARDVVTRFTTYAESIESKLNISRSSDFWLPSAQQRLEMKMKFLLGWY